MTRIIVKLGDLRHRRKLKIKLSKIFGAKICKFKFIITKTSLSILVKNLFNCFIITLSLGW